MLLRTRTRRFGVATLFMLATTAPSAAQIQDSLDVGGEYERRVLTARLAGAPLVALGGQGASWTSAGILTRTVWNSRFPQHVEQGSAWTGRGATGSLVGRGGIAWRGISLRLAPELWTTENRATRLVPVGGANPFGDPMRPCCIDLPQQLGTGAVARLDAGQSTLEVSAWGGRVALTSATRRIGAGLSHSILMSPDAPGFPRVEVGTAERLRTPVGDFSFTLAAGQLGQTPQAPERRAGSRSGSFFEGRWRPFADDRFELGGARFYNRDWQGARLGDLLSPFGSLFFDAQTFGGGTADNQLLSLFGTLRPRGTGLELWAEFGLNDRQTDAREFAVELEHNSAWLFGLRRAWQAGDGAVWNIEATGASARIPPIEVFRGQATFYQHAPVTQGHTNRGHLLGTRLLERNGGVELRVERFSGPNRIGVLVGTRDLANQRALAVAEANLRREWSVVTEAFHTDAGGREWFLRLGGIADLNRYADGRDAYSALVGAGFSWRWTR